MKKTLIEYSSVIIVLMLLACQFDISAQTSRKTIPYTLPWDDMPVDLSFVYAKEKPAGRHGFLTVKGDKFIFEDGTEARFWGTCFNSGQCFPSHEHSAKVARRLAKIGINIVRFHQMDAEWSTPNIFQFTKGENKVNTRNFDPVSLDRLDYLISKLKEEGIYIYLDLLTYRRFKEGDGIENAYKIKDSAKPYSTFDAKLIELQKEFNYRIWTHINPYTGLAYKDDPSIVLTEITNECDLFSQAIAEEPFRSQLEERYRAWAKENKIKTGKEKIEFDIENKNIQQFFIEVTKNYYTEMISHMRETGVKIPISGTNWSKNGALLEAQTVTDFTDSHAYLANRRDATMKFGNHIMTGIIPNMIPSLAFFRTTGKPFFVSEWDNSWPNEWRAEGSLLMAAVGSFQGWGGFALHTYRYGLDENVDMIGKPITSMAIGGVSYRSGVFDTFNDPAKFGLFYHAALIMRRADVTPASQTAYVKLDNYSWSQRPVQTVKALELTAEKHRTEVVLPTRTAGGNLILKPGDNIPEVSQGEVMSDTKELYRNLNKKIGWIDSPRTKVVYGMVGNEGDISLNNLKINVKTDFATVAISSLTDAPVQNSDNLLLTAVGRADNTGAKYNETHDHQIEIGHGPIQVEIIEATVELKTDKKNLRVFSINPQGFIIGYIPCEYKDGVFRFEIGKEYQSMYYLIQSL
jgi:hypothetical protein